MGGYLDSTGRADVLSGGIRRVPVATPGAEFLVWTKRTGNNPDCQLLLLHGGPGATHEYFLGFDSFLPAAGVEYYYYDQLGSGWSDVPEDPSLWEVDRFVDEVEQVRTSLGLERFFLLGQSWGGLLAIEYALAHGDNLAGLVISNMMASIPAYNRYAEDVLIPQLDPAVIAEVRAMAPDDPRQEEVLMDEHYVKHVLRLPAQDWPEPVARSFARTNRDIYIRMQGPSELGVSGTLASWDRFDDLSDIATPTLVIGAEYDTMDPVHMKAMADKLPRGEYLHCPRGSHLSMYDDQEVYMAGLLDWLARQVSDRRRP